jgi:hypothetical protein
VAHPRVILTRFCSPATQRGCWSISGLRADIAQDPRTLVLVGDEDVVPAVDEHVLGLCYELPSGIGPSLTVGSGGMNQPTFRGRRGGVESISSNR